MPDVTLEEVFGSLADQLPEEDEASFVLNSSILPQPPALMKTDRLVVQAGKHNYYSYAYSSVDALHFHADKRTYRLFGLCLLAKVFHAEPQSIQIVLPNMRSNIRTILLDYNQFDGWNLISHYDKRPYAYTYQSQPVVETHKELERLNLPSWLLPTFTLTDAVDIAGPGDIDVTRDMVRCVGSDYGSIVIAGMLLNLGRSSETQNEFVIESEHGFGGVGLGSAEVTFWLPGSIGYIEA